MLTFNQQSAETQVLGDRLQAVGVFAGLLGHAGGPPDQMGFLVGPNGSAGLSSSISIWSPRPVIRIGAVVSQRMVSLATLTSLARSAKS